MDVEKCYCFVCWLDYGCLCLVLLLDCLAYLVLCGCRNGRICCKDCCVIKLCICVMCVWRRLLMCV